jgi:subtilisin family serine protease
LLIKPKSRLADAELDRRLLMQGGKKSRKLHRSTVRVLEVSEDRLLATMASLQNDPDIEFVEPDCVATAAFVPNDPYVQSGDAWHLSTVRATGAWDYSRGNPGVIVAVLDSGVMAGNPDLIGRVLAGYDFVNNDADVTDDFGHGTAVTGAIVAAGDNGIGTAGMAFGCRVLPVKVMNATGYAYYSTIAEGIRYAVDHGVRVINISIAGESTSWTLQEAVDYAWGSNVVVVCAAGNNGNSVPLYPAACNHVLTVSATDRNDTLATFSSFGNHIALAAPGVDIWTTQRFPENYFGAWRGTSLASPVIAGAAALLASAKPELTGAEIISLLQQSADDLGIPGRDDAFGHGRLNIERALLMAGATIQPPPPVVEPFTVTVNVPVATVFQQGAEIPLTAGINGGSGALALLEFFSGDLKLMSFATPPFELDWLPGSPGDFSVFAVAVDTQGQRATSAPVSIRVTGSALTVPLRLNIEGLGTVSPMLDGRLLEIGRTYTVRARPDRDQLFAGWTGADAGSRTLSFVMRAGLKLTARFVESPFLNMKGSFHGLAVNEKAVAPESSAAFTLTMTKLGAFSGKLQIAGRSHSFRGQFDLNGNAVVTVRRELALPVQLNLAIDLTGGGTEITGTLASGGWASMLRADRNGFNATLNPAPQAGQVEFVLECGVPASTTVATGANRISATGRARMAGNLLDGRRFSRSAGIANSGDFPFYLSLSCGTEVVIGWVNFPAASATADGTVLWTRSGVNGFATTLQATGVH